MEGTEVRIKLGSMASAKVGDELSINPALLRVNFANAWESEESSVKVNLDPPDGLGAEPMAVIRAPSIFALGCGPLHLDGSMSSGGLYQNMTYSWELEITGAGNSTLFDNLVA